MSDDADPALPEEEDMCGSIENEPVPMQVEIRDEDKSPHAAIMIRAINNVDLARPLTALLDSGSNKTWIQRQCLPKGCDPNRVEAHAGATIVGTLRSNQIACSCDMALPEFNKNRP